MESGFEGFQHDYGEAALAGRHGSRLTITPGLEGRMVSSRVYQNVVTQDHARGHYGDHYGDQHHHYYPEPSGGPGTEAMDQGSMEQLMKALSFPQKNYRFTTIEHAYRQTCQWLFTTPEYSRWRDRDLRQEHHGILWMKGKPGAGKSTITKFALEYANAAYPAERNISFFFHARGDKLEKCDEGMYRSLLHQVARFVPHLLQIVDTEAVAAYAEQGWPVGLLRSLFREAALQLSTKTQLNCYIDALDEGGNEDQIREMVRFFEELAETAVANGLGLSVYLASRHYPNVSVRLSEIIILDDYKGHDRDIASYTRNMIRCRQSALKEELINTIIQRSSGIFLWVVLVVRILNRESDRGNQHRLRSYLETIPKGLDDLFRDIVGHSDDDEHLLPTLLWVLFPMRPMCLVELCVATLSCTAPDFSSSVVRNYELRASSMKDFITSSSKGLLQYAAPTVGVADFLEDYHDLRGDHVVQFIHESVREYLLKSGIRQLDTTLSENPVGTSNLYLAQWCQRYLELSVQARLVARFEEMTYLEPSVQAQFLINRFGEMTYRKRDLESMLLDFPFLSYALAGILHHSEAAACREVDVQIPFEDCLQTCLPLFVACDTQEFPVVSKRTALHVLVKAGCITLVSKLLERYHQPARQRYIDLGVEGGREHNNVALHFAARERTLDIVQVLLGSGADVHTRDKNGTTPLLLAIRTGMTEMVEMILSYGADANTADNDDTALLAAVQTGIVDTVEMLLRHGADVNARVVRGPTPLLSAVSYLNPAMVSAIIAHAPDVNAKDRDGYTPMHVAMRAPPGKLASIQILDMLLQHGADVHVRCRGEPLLLTAVVSDDLCGIERVQALLKHGADVNASDRTGRTALHAAVERDEIEVINVLLHYHADVDARNEWGATPLILAVSDRRSASTEVVEILLTNGADIDAADRSDNTALCAAVRSRNVELVKTLLIYGADVHSQKEGHQSIVDIAKEKDDPNITRLLTYFADIPSHARLEAASALEG